MWIWFNSVNSLRLANQCLASPQTASWCGLGSQFCRGVRGLESRPCFLGFSPPGIESFGPKMGWGGGRLPAEFATNSLESASRPAGQAAHGFVGFCTGPRAQISPICGKFAGFSFLFHGRPWMRQEAFKELRDEESR